MKMVAITALSIFQDYHGQVLPDGLLSNVPHGEGRLDVLWYIFNHIHSETTDQQYMWYFRHDSTLPIPLFEDVILSDIHTEFVSYTEDYEAHEELHDENSYPQLILDKDDDGTFILRVESYHQNEDICKEYFLEEEVAFRYLSAVQNYPLYNNLCEKIHSSM